MSTILDRAKTFLSAFDGITLYDGHPAVIVREMADRIEALERERDEARTTATVAVKQCLDEAEAHEAEVTRLKEALTPSGETKAAYMGEFTIAVERHVNEDEEPEDEAIGSPDPYEHITVPWTTIKEIMAAIRARAARSVLEEQKP